MLETGKPAVTSTAGFFHRRFTGCEHLPGDTLGMPPMRFDSSYCSGEHAGGGFLSPEPEALARLPRRENVLDLERSEAAGGEIVGYSLECSRGFDRVTEFLPMIEESHDL